MINYNTYYEGYDHTCDVSLTKLHKHKENAYVEMLDKLGVSEEQYISEGMDNHCSVIEVEI